MHAHRAPSTPSLARRGPRGSVGSFLVSLVLAGCVLGSAALPGRAQAQAQARAIVLSFEGGPPPPWPTRSGPSTSS
jgi:hypothetical protein